MADSNLLAALLSGQDPLAPGMVPGYQGAQLSAQAVNPEFGHNEGLFGALAKTLAGFAGPNMLQNSVQNTTAARTAAQPDLARLMASTNAYQDLAANPQGFDPVARAAFLNGGPEQALRYQMGQQEINSGALKNLAALSQVRGQSAALGGQMPSAQDVRSGAYQGPNWPQVFGAPGSAGGASGTSGSGGVPDVGGLWGRIKAAEGGIGPNGEARTSSKGAVGVSQILPSTARDVAGSLGIPYDEARLHADQGYNETLGRAYFGQQLDRFQNNPVLAAAAYNAGPDRVDSWRKTIGDPLSGEISDDAFAQRIPINETRHYVARVTGAGRQYAQAGPITASDAGGVQAGNAGGSVPNMSLGSVARDRALSNALQIPIPQSVSDYQAAQTMAPGPARDLAMAQAMKSGGLDVVQNIRAQGTLLGLDPNNPLGPPKVLYHAPELPLGTTVKQSPSGDLGAVQVPGTLQAEEAAARAKARGAGEYKPEIYYDARGNPVQGTAAQAPQFAADTRPQGLQQAPQSPAAAGGLVPGGAIPGGLPAAPPAAPPAQSKQNSYGAAPTFLANTPVGQKDISQVHITDMFPGGAGIPQPGGPAGPPTEMQKEIQKSDADRLEGYNKEQAGNQQINQDLLRLHGVLERGFVTSGAARIGSELANLAHGFGADWAYPKGWAPANAAEFDKASTDLVFAALKTLPGQPRVTEIVGLQKANPSITIPRETNYQMMNDILARSKWQDERARLGTEFVVQNKGVPLSVFDSAYNRMAPLPDVANEYMGALRKAGAVFPEDVPAGGGPAPTPPAGTMRTHNGINYHKVGDQWFPEVK